MRPSTQFIAVATVLLATAASQAALTYKGCYSSSTGLSVNDTAYIYQSSGYCQTQCVNADNYAVLGLTSREDCWCGNELPPADTLVAKSKCSATCAGYDLEQCGSSDGTYFTVWLTGTESSVANANHSSDASSSAAGAASPTASTASTTETAAPSVVTVGSTIVTITAPAQLASVSAAADDKHKKSKANTAGIIAGVVVGIVAIGAIAGGAFLFLRHRRRRAIEEEYQRNASINNFVANGKPPGSSAGYSNVTDTRLDHSALQRRMSDGSIADNEDYSRKILRVTNA